ncbi:right-handed parallel beta-helix repeat-containing protein [Sorangium atrum]|uniref:Right-handed parallel beta-helix repeat-containing protein n=1 Tax=Sorangium atrum TaxID=2995308 RepID=A0ABT5CGC0_9BACT|nr:right-handed parallel beta-helix repeat-containing protein [Sorangium aterium]MDC0685485.1 right-handed parallel beta-helix repeat-containing protein [Sorangium aterium]
MVNFRDWIVRWPLAVAWTWALVTALVVMGCGDQVDAAAKACAPGEAAREDGTCEPRPCSPGENTLETGVCQPAGLPPDMSCPPGELALESSECHPAGVPPDMPCPPGELALESGECQPAGVPPEACGTGFAGDGNGGCKAILPENGCPEGQMAIPGETSCREVAPCGNEPWGDIPVEANTQFVDQAYAGGDSDGTRTKPWTKIQRGIDEAVDGAIVAVADGSYPEDVEIRGKAVRLWGRCPALVEIRGTDPSAQAIEVDGNAATGTEIRRLAVTGEGAGLFMAGAHDVTIEQVWVHNTGSQAIFAQTATRHRTSMVLKGSLVEQNREIGVIVNGSDATIESTVVRTTQPRADGEFGWGIGVQDDSDTGERASVTVRASLVEQNHDVGVIVIGSDATIESTVVRTTQPSPDGTVGRGIGVQDDPDTGELASVTIRACLVEQNHDEGVFVIGSDAMIEATVVRATQPRADGTAGRGINIENAPDTGERARVTIRACVVEQNHDLGVIVIGSDATIEATVVRATQPSADGTAGRGINVEDDPDRGGRASVTIRACVVEQNHELGVLVAGSNAAIESTVVRATQPQADGTAGRGIGVQAGHDINERASVTIRACVVEQNHDLGVIVSGSDAKIEATVVRATQPQADGTGGWGIGVQKNPRTGERAGVTVRACVVERNHDEGVFVYGSDAAIEATVVRATQPNADREFGRGIVVQNDADTDERASVTVHACVVEQNHDVGVLVVGSDATIEATVVRATQLNADGEWGSGIVVQAGRNTSGRAGVTVRACVVEQNHDVGVLVVGSEATIEATVVRATQPSADGTGGKGIGVEGILDRGERGSVTIRASLVEQNHEVGVVVIDSDATIEATIVRTTTARHNNTFGDGIVTILGTATIQNATITNNPRAGIANFGSEVTILATTLACNAFDLNGENVGGSRASFDGSSGWRCTRRGAEDCVETDDRCHVETANLEPPPPVEQLPPFPPLPPP